MTAQEPTGAAPSPSPSALLGIGVPARPPLVLRRLRQADPEQYRNLPPGEFRSWANAACGAASFATLVNAADSERGMTVGQAVEFLVRRGLLSTRRGLLRGDDLSDVARALNEALGRDAAYAVNLRSPERVRAHFEGGGGPIMFTGPSAAVWGVPHIYVATGASARGLEILDSSEAGRPFLSWPEWQAQTGNPGRGAGVALRLP